jgi:hypothetical protein
MPAKTLRITDAAFLRLLLGTGCSPYFELLLAALLRKRMSLLMVSRHRALKAALLLSGEVCPRSSSVKRWFSFFDCEGLLCCSRILREQVANERIGVGVGNRRAVRRSHLRNFFCPGAFAQRRLRSHVFRRMTGEALMLREFDARRRTKLRRLGRQCDRHRRLVRARAAQPAGGGEGENGGERCALRARAAVHAFTVTVAVSIALRA